MRGIGRAGTGEKMRIVTKFDEWQRGETINILDNGKCSTSPPIPIDFFETEGSCEILDKNMEPSTWSAIKKLIVIEPPIQRQVQTRPVKKVKQ
ncbi:MAG TPA: hypothetical protein ENI20_08450 [Bacteroides sp.]|nr:hypothetical protein [Bacteroides sp.]